MDYKRLRPSQVLLDSQNPRLPDGTSNDKDAINRLIAEGSAQLIALGRDLTDKGESNPAELPIVVQDGTKYVVLEGNRRFAALKLINDPLLADDHDVQRAFIRLNGRTGSAPRSLYCAVARDRIEADPWITLRHTGANEGVGVRTWNAEQTARHRKRMSAPVDAGTGRSIAIADDLEETYQEDAYLVGLIKAVRTEKLTNIGRFFSGVTLAGLQLEIRPSDDKSGRVFVKNSPHQLHDYFIWAFEFLRDNSVDSFKNDKLRTALLTSNSHLLPGAASSSSDHVWIVELPFNARRDTALETGTNAPDATAAGQSGRVDNAIADGNEVVGALDDLATTDDKSSIEEAALEVSTASDETDSLPDPADQPDPTDSNSEAGDGRTSMTSRKRDTRPEAVLFSNVRLPNLSSQIQRLLREAKSLKIDENYATACVLARVILELSVSDENVLRWSGKRESESLERKIRACIYKLDPDIDNAKKTRQDLVQAFVEINGVGVTYMHQFMHNPSAKPDPHLARRFSSAFTPLLNSINEEVA